jgi:hypothetical protein
MTLEDFEYITESCIFLGLSPSRLSLHLHVKEERIREIKQIIHKALDLKITQFDVSNLKSGGCSVTMKKEQIAPNLSYDLYYESIVNYIEKKCGFDVIL